MTIEELARRIDRTKVIGKTHTTDETARIVRLPKAFVWGVLMGGKYFLDALKDLEMKGVE